MELRYAVRQLTRNPRFTAIAALTLALGIAGVSVVFAAVNALVFDRMRAGSLDGLYNVTFVRWDAGISGPPTAQQFRRLEADAPPSIARLGAMVFYPRPVVAAVTPTAGGLVFSADLRGVLRAFDAETGAVLWEHDAGQSIGGGIVSYAVGGRQRVAVASGMKSLIWPGGAEQSRILVFGLP